MGFVNNLLVGLATGLLAFHTNMAFDDKVSLSILETWLVIPSLISMFLSLAIGCYLAWNRLDSFRLTAQIARKREKDSLEGIDELRSVVKCLDCRTWMCIRWQAILFALGGLLLLAVAIAGYLR